ncbi:hypothetical protein PMIN04_007328 [Paraphaeosphaeria minitans]
MAYLKDRVILLTGAASGIGLATAHVLASRGAKLSLADANPAGLSAATHEIEERCPGVALRTCVVDVRNEEQVRVWVEGAKEAWGRVDGAANVAGVIGEFEHGFRWLVSCWGRMRALGAVSCRIYLPDEKKGWLCLGS